MPLSQGQLFWIGRLFANLLLPKNWERKIDENGQYFYVNSA